MANQPCYYRYVPTYKYNLGYNRSSFLGSTHFTTDQEHILA